ncbi:Hpt domain-containing protein [Flavobacterium sp. MXW15]|uniref:histidine kinase n=1 Tax=Xanthomonas chitinilytica TaxID=2989819 RepID=A0ABT3K0F7_9XANT|nr:Hpt domain-containing protein [Xanthomonas sp. H13-6]MCW4456215.1 Hpt domain-containing protein [Flavobacterium sp. MXW15]MCW4473900.1 Hpt domain-containing protein [Xanthomonas sp. H13-6]
MSTLRDAMSHAALGWVKPELDETLRQVRNEIEYFVEEPSDTSRMRFCAGYLHQVQGTLRMVELYAPAMVAEELELLANAVQAGGVPDRDEACATLMRGTVLLPDYLERLQNGHRDIPIVLLPLLNEIRAARGAEGISESVLFAFDPDAGSASEAELDHARGSLSGRNRELLDTVGSAVKEELLRIKDALDLHLRTGGEPAALQTQVNELGAVADTLGVLGLGVARGVVVQQRDSLRGVVDGSQQIDEGMLLDIAGALLYVDASLDDQVAHLGAGGSGEDDPGSVETRRTVEVLAHEAIANFSAAREHFVAFIETNWDHQRLADVPRLLGEVAGALRMLDLPTPADYLQGVRRYIEVELIARQRVPSGRQLDTLADAMASLEYYLEALRERRPGREEILDITRSSLEALRYWPLPTAESEAAAAMPPAPQPEAVVQADPAPATTVPASVAPAEAPAVAPVANDTSRPAELPVVEVPAPTPAQTPAPVATEASAPATEAPRPYPYVFQASVTPYPSPGRDDTAAVETPAFAPDTATTAASSTGFDPVAAEEGGAADGAGYTLAPIDLSGDGTAELPPAASTEDVLEVAPTVFDPVAAEQEQLDTDAAAQVYTFDSSLLETGEPAATATTPAAAIEPALPSQDAAVASVQALDAAAPEAGLPVSTVAAPLPPELPTPAEPAVAADAGDTGAAQAPVEQTPAAPEPTPTSAIEPDAAAQATPTPAAEPEPEVRTAAVAGVQDAVIGKIELDDESAAFLAELDAAAAQFNPLPEKPAPAAEAEAVPPPAPEAPVMLDGGFEDNGDEIDQDIREVFIEEFDEELVNLGNLLPQWRAAPANVDRLRPVRRVFHTLKGSGRLVGARTLGEFSWKIESMLNRVLDGSRPASPAVVAMVTQAYEVLPQLNAALRDGSGISADLLAMQAVADRVAAGEETFYVPTPAAATTAAAPVAEVAPPVPAGTPASVDSVLREILEAEVATHLETLREWLAASQQQPQPVNEALLRAVHTMSGAFAMTDVPEITAVTTPAETYVKRSLAAAVTPGDDGVAAIADTADAIAATIVALQAPAPMIPSFSALAQRLQVLVDALPEAKWPPLAVDELSFADGEDDLAAPAASTVDPVELTGVEDLSRYLGAEPGDTGVSASVDADVSPVVPTGEADGFTFAAEDVPAPEVASVDDGNAADAGIAPADVQDEAWLQDAFIEPVVETPVTAVVDAGEQPVISGGDAAAPAQAAEDLPSFAAESTASVDAPAATDAADTFAGSVEQALPAAPLAGPEVVEEPSAQPAVENETIVDATVQASGADVVATAVEEVPTEEVAATDGGEQVEAVAATDAGDAADAVEAASQVAGTPAAETAAVDAAVPGQPVDALSAAIAAAIAVGTGGADSAVGDDEPLDFSDLDRELVDIFVEEGKDLLDHCDGLISELREAPEDRELLAGLQRDLHTLKGGARMAGINAIGDLGHGIESLLEAVAANRTDITRSDVQLLERGFDRLHQLLTRTGAHRAVAMPFDLIEAFDARTHGRAEAHPEVAATVEIPAVAAVESVPAAESPAPETVEVTADTTAAEAQAVAEAPQPRPLPVPETPTVAKVAPLSEPVVEEASGEEEGGVRSQEQVRVRADLLDRLVNHAGEVAIYRSRLEQQLGAFRGAMAELDRTNARLRDQLRRLDLETEAQIVARYQREQDQADQTFDPLELDRFSTLQQLSRALNESAADLSGLQGVLDDLSRNYDALLQQQSRVSSELQDGLMRARMVPFDGLVPRLRRVVRQAAHDTGKQVHLTLDGTHGELDRNVLDRMVAPLEHMLRNSVAHGLETPAQRVAAGKPEEGGITIRLRREGSEIVLEVADDGAGLDREAIRRRAEQRNLIQPGAELSENELDSLIFASGFSTSEQVSQLAGRGVGMDVVRNEVRQLGGSVDIHSVRGKGVTFTLRLPQTLAVTQAVFVQIGETTFAVPVASVSGIGRISRERFESGDGGYHYSGEHYALHDLGSLVGQESAKAEGQAQIPLLLVRAGDLRAAVAIDQVLGNREIVVKPVGLQIASVPGIYGATITGDGRVVVILDVAPLVRRHLAQPQRALAQPAPASQRQVPMVMVVDDSLTMRKVTGRVLERHNFEVVAARDGIEALERLEERVPDLMLLDIEMPRMDGYELATAMRADPRYKDVPIVMITSRSGDKHRQRAFEIGVQRYLGKPYQELDLMRNVYDLLGIARARE